MEESTPTTNSSTDIFNEIEPSPKPEDLCSSVSSIPPETSVFWSSQLQKNKKTPSDHENDRVSKYAKYFKENITDSRTGSSRRT